MAIIVVFPGYSVCGGMLSVVKDLDRQFLQAGEKVVYVETHAKSSRWGVISVLSSIGCFIYLLCTNKIDAIHIHSASRGSFFRKSIFCILGTFAGKRTVMHMHGGAFSEFYAEQCGFVRSYIAYIFARHIDCLIVLTDGWKRWFESEFTFISLPVVVRNSVELVSCPSKKSERFKLVFVGRLVKEKGVSDLLNAIANIDGDKDFEVKIIGGGDGRFEKESMSLGLCEKVEFLGEIPRDNVLAEISSATALVLPSYHEGLPIVILEAMACETAVLATRVGGIPDVLKDKKSGVLFEPSDIKRLTKEIQRLINNREDCMRLAKNGYDQWYHLYRFNVNFPILLSALKGK